MPSFMEGITDPAAAKAAAEANAKTPQAAKDALRQWEKTKCIRSSSISKAKGFKLKGGGRARAIIGLLGLAADLFGGEPEPAPAPTCEAPLKTYKISELQKDPEALKKAMREAGFTNP
jgi:hypothetical protein